MYPIIRVPLVDRQTNQCTSRVNSVTKKPETLITLKYYIFNYYSTRSDWSWGHRASYTTGTRYLSQAYSGRGVALTTHSHLQLRLKKEYSYNSTPPLNLHGLF
jgi:hypothetical protein